MNRQKLDRLLAGFDQWDSSFKTSMEYRESDGLSWYDLSVNANNIPCKAKVAVIVTSWYEQLKWLRATLTSYRKSGAFVVLAYDNPLVPWQPTTGDNILRIFPSQQHYMLAHSVVTKHITYDCNKRNGWFWDVRYAQGVLRSFPQLTHVYVTNGDCIWDKPEGLGDLVTLLGDSDLMSGQQSGETLHTADVLFQADTFHKVVDHMYATMRIPIIGSHSAEKLLCAAVKELSLKVKVAPIQPIDPLDKSTDMYCRYGQPSTFRDIVGFRNLFAEYECAGNEGRDVLFIKPYVDISMDGLYWRGEERETVCKYLATGDKRYLWQWWDRWEESDYNRLYYPLEHYGCSPIYGT